MNRSALTVILNAMFLVQLSCPQPVAAQTAVDLLSGFDTQRLGKIQIPAEGEFPQATSDEIAKLLFRMHRLADQTLRERADRDTDTRSVGDAVPLDGKIESIQHYRISKKLIDMLGFEQISVVTLRPQSDASPTLRLALARLPSEASLGDRLSGVGVLVSTGPVPFFAANRLAWSPKNMPIPSWAAINACGIDLSRLAEIADKNGQSLTTTDSDVFYRLIRSAAAIASSETSLALAARASGKEIQPIELLQRPKSWLGHWILLDLETVRITRVAVDAVSRRQEIGADHYYQIDAIGDLGNVQVQIDRPGREPALMQNRYPVTLVAATLPDWMNRLNGEPESLVVTHKTPVRVEGFFYRLWSYESEWMETHGGGKQTAPLIMVGRFTDRRPQTTDAVGVGIVGKLCAVAVLLGIVAVTLFQIITTHGDRLARWRRLNN